MTDAELLELFKREHQDYNQLMRKTRVYQLTRLDRFAAFSDKPLYEVNGDDLQGFASSLLDKGMHVNTVDNHMKVVKLLAGWLYRRGDMDADRWLKINAVKPPRGVRQWKPNPYTRKEIIELWRTLDDRFKFLPETGRRSQALTRWLKGTGKGMHLHQHSNRLQLGALIRLALDLGLRRDEMYGMKVADLHYDNEYLVIQGKRNPRTGKVKVRTIPFTDEARNAIREWLEFRALLRVSHDSPWLTLWGQFGHDPISRTVFANLLPNRLGSQWKWHRLRHTAGTNWLRAGVPLEIVSKMLGHATITQTLGYAEIVGFDLAKHMALNETAFEALSGPEADADADIAA